MADDELTGTCSACQNLIHDLLTELRDNDTVHLLTGEGLPFDRWGLDSELGTHELVYKELYEELQILLACSNSIWSLQSHLSGLPKPLAPTPCSKGTNFPQSITMRYVIKSDTLLFNLWLLYNQLPFCSRPRQNRRAYRIRSISETSVCEPHYSSASGGIPHRARSLDHLGQGGVC